MRVDIFCESGTKYGLGHFYRCVKLAAICIKTKQVSDVILHNRGDFIPPPLSNLLDKADSIQCKNYEWLSAQHTMLDVAIVDSYEAQEWFYYTLKSQSKALICLDDTLRDVYPPKSYILNPTPNVQEYFSTKDYHLWCGEEYVITPIALPTQNNATYRQDYETYNIFINFGGVDSTNLTQDIIYQLSQQRFYESFTKCHFHIVLGNGYTHHLSIPHHISSQISLYHHLNPLDFLSKAKECDFAISAGGGSMLELIMLKVPSIIIESASNQHIHITQWAQMGAIATATNPLNALLILQSWCEADSKSHKSTPFSIKSSTHLESSPDMIRHTLDSLSLGASLPKALSALFAYINHPHITYHTNNTQSNAPTAIPFTDLTQEEAEIILSIRNHPQVAQWMYSTHITALSHYTFLQELKDNHSKRYWLFKHNDEYIGVGSLTRINLTHKNAFIGIYANPLCTQSNKGKRILSFLESFATNDLALHTLHLEVLKHNERAIRFYEKCGYIYEGVLHDFILHKDKEQRRYYDVILMYKECQ